MAHTTFIIISIYMTQAGHMSLTTAVIMSKQLVAISHCSLSLPQIKNYIILPRPLLI